VNWASLFQGIGESGGQFAQAKLDVANDKIKKMLADLKMQEGKTTLEESQERLKRLKLQPATEDAALQEKISALRKAAQSLGIELKPEDYRSILGLGIPATQIKTPFELWRAEHPTGTAEEFQKFQETGKSEKRVEVKEGLITDAQGKTWDVNDPALPEDLKKLVKATRKAHTDDLTEKATIEARKSAEALQRAIALGDIRGQQKQRMEVVKTVQRGISGHGFLRTVAQEVASADAGGGAGNKYGDMLIAEGFMQLMFGKDPKALRGSPGMLETTLKEAGGWDDRAIAEINKAYNGGRLSQAVRNQILEAATRQVAAWDQQVFQTGELLAEDDPKTKSIVEKYRQKVAEGNSLSDLGGTKVQ
jgi:hypothetical protein